MAAVTPAKPILFISHDANRTGAPILLLHFLRWLKEHAGTPFEILLRNGGPLQGAFESLAPVRCLHENRDGRYDTSAGARVRRRLLLERVRRSRPRLIYANTVTNGDVLDRLAPAHQPVITHAHELEDGIRRFAGPSFAHVVERTDRYIACCEAVKEHLVTGRGIDAATITVIHGFIDVRDASAPERAAARQRVSAELGIPPGAAIVGASGTTDWRKAPEVFVQMAGRLTRMNRGGEAHFVWVGGHGPGSARFAELQYDSRRLGLDGRMHFLGERADAAAIFGAFDVFALVSREDPFPLVCLEAAAMGIPIVCFAGAGGEPEFVRDDCGFVVPYLDLDEMASRIAMLLASDEMRQRFGEQAQSRVRTLHDVGRAAPLIHDVIERTVAWYDRSR